MRYALDTNTISYILQNIKGVAQRWQLEEAQGNIVSIPLIAYHEVKRGLIKAGATSKLSALEKLCNTIEIDDITAQDADTAIRIYAKLRGQGNLIDDADILIAAQSINRGYTLVTSNTKHFDRIDGLNFVDWVK